MGLARTKFTYRRGVVCRFTQTLVFVESERSMLIVLVSRAVGLVLGMIVGEKTVRLWARVRLEGVGLGYEGAHIHGGQDQSGGW